MYQITEKYINKNRPKTPLKAIGGVIHETANPNDTAFMEREYFNNNDVSASAHAFIDATTILQTIPWSEKAWHCGKTGNAQFWGVELCHTTDPAKFGNIWAMGTWLYAYLFTQVAKPRITKVTCNNLMSHKEVSDTWKETDHQDPVSYFAKFGKTVDDFRTDVQKEIDNILLRENVDKLVKAGIVQTAEYWTINAKKGVKLSGNFATILIKNMAFYFDKKPITYPLEQAIATLNKNGVIISTPEYWVKNQEGSVDGEYVAILISRMASKIK